MLSFSNNPQDFIQDWLKSQSRDLKVNVIPFFLHFTGIAQQRFLKWRCGNLARRSLTDLLMLWGILPASRRVQQCVNLFHDFLNFYHLASASTFNIYTDVLVP